MTIYHEHAISKQICNLQFVLEHARHNPQKKFISDSTNNEIELTQTIHRNDHSKRTNQLPLYDWTAPLCVRSLALRSIVYVYRENHYAPPSFKSCASVYLC